MPSDYNYNYKKENKYKKNYKTNYKSLYKNKNAYQKSARKKQLPYIKSKIIISCLRVLYGFTATFDLKNKPGPEQVRTGTGNPDLIVPFKACY